MKLIVALLALPLLGTGSFRLHAEPLTQTTPAPVAHQPWAASDKDIVGQWDWAAGGDLGWRSQFHPDHTLTAYFEGYGEVGPIVSTWALKNNHVLVDEAPFIKFLGSGYHAASNPEDKSHYSAIAMNFGSDLQVIHYQGYVVLYSAAEEADVLKYGPVPFYCFWQYQHTKKGNTLPLPAMKLDKQVFETLMREQRQKR